ncbi:MAG: hypothetical protein PHQ66_02150 [Candidatus Nanoarchaeia archaeon]|nr:hypothetical protein [Candidatus Nanoarchaeia archaeon]MDD5357826.1 hypothetical protein [Candidatus Nanoarchaeia archaeon]MDD5588745.1 hypothetical protein [Candidatus Nanoarchaeia archaeon]
MHAVIKKYNKPALAIAVFVSVLHALWLILVASGFAQVLMDWIYSLHMLSNPFIVMSFDMVNAIILLIVPALMSYIAVLLFGLVWKMMVKK